MEAVLEEVEETLKPTPAKVRPPLSKEELEERRYSVDFARANVELEGLRAGKDHHEMMERYARGEIDLEDLREYADRLIANRQKRMQGK